MTFTFVYFYGSMRKTLVAAAFAAFLAVSATPAWAAPGPDSRISQTTKSASFSKNQTMPAWEQEHGHSRVAEMLDKRSERLCGAADGARSVSSPRTPRTRKSHPQAGMM